MSRLWILSFSLAALTMCAGVFPAKEGNRPTTVRVLNPSLVEGVPGAVVLLNPGDVQKSRAFVTDANGAVTISDPDCRVCIISAMDPRHLFQSETTEFEGGAGSVTLVLPVRPIVDIVGQPGSIKATVQVNGPDGSPLPSQAVLFRNKVETIEDDWSAVLTTDPRGTVSIQLLPGDYVVASVVRGKFLEGPIDLAPEIRDKCSKAKARCFIDAAAHWTHRTLAVSLASRSE